MKRLFTPFLFAALLMAACAEIGEPDAAPEATRSGGDVTEFDTLPNPYSLKVMQAVYDSGGGDTVLEATDLYVRFLPQDSMQLNLIMYDCGLELFDYPLDLDIGEGEVYIDPSIPDGELMWHYTTVKPGFVFPEGVTYEILEECYIPEEDEFIPTLTRSGIIDVERAAFEMIGYTIAPDEPQTRAASTRPVGTIRVYDNRDSAYVGVRGVKIRCHTVVKWSTAFTDETGYYSMGSKFTARPHYAIVFDNCKGFDIWGNWGPLARANYNMGWHGNSGFSKDIPDSSQAWEWAAVNNAGYDYYRMCETTGITKPPSNLKVWVFKGESASSAPMIHRLSAMRVLTKENWFTFLAWGTGKAVQLTVLAEVFKLLLPDITIGTNGDDYGEIYNVVHHEFAHASHYSKVGKDYWAEYISRIVENLGYGSSGGAYAGVCEVGEMWGHAMGYIQEYEKYNTEELDDPYPGWTINDWISPDPIWALITRGILTKKQVYDCLTSDVKSRTALIDKMCQKYPTKAGLIRVAFADNNVIVPTITGPYSTVQGEQVTYRIPSDLTDSMVFDGWEIGTTNFVADTLLNTVMNITFTSEGQFLLAANFTLPGDIPYQVARIVSVSPPPVPFVVTAPRIGCEILVDVSFPYSIPVAEVRPSIGLWEESVSTNGVVPPDVIGPPPPRPPLYTIITIAEFHVKSPQGPVTYDWVLNGEVMGFTWFGDRFAVKKPEGPTSFTVSCIARYGEEEIQGVNTIRVTVTEAGDMTCRPVSGIPIGEIFDPGKIIFP